MVQYSTHYCTIQFIMVQYSTLWYITVLLSRVHYSRSHRSHSSSNGSRMNTRKAVDSPTVLSRTRSRCKVSSKSVLQSKSSRNESKGQGSRCDHSSNSESRGQYFRNLTSAGHCTYEIQSGLDLGWLSAGFPQSKLYEVLASGYRRRSKPAVTGETVRSPAGHDQSSKVSNVFSVEMPHRIAYNALRS